MKKLYFILFFLFTAHVAFTQANAGPDLVICDGKKVQIGKTDDNKNCYLWEASPADPNLVSQAHLAKPMVNPAQTTTYTLSVIGPEFKFISKAKVKVSVFEFKEIVVKENSEPVSYFDKPQVGGSIFMTGAFNFKVNTESKDESSVTLNWDIYDLDNSQEIDKGFGKEFTHKFSSPGEEGKVRVRFWYDKGTNIILNDGCVIETVFEVKKIREHMFSVARASTTVPLSDAGVDAILESGTDLIKVKQDKNDFRCACELKRDGSVSLWTPDLPLMPDAIYNGFDFANINANINARIKIVKEIRYCGMSYPRGVVLGCTRLGVANSIVIAEGLNADTWTHEIGHSLGLNHRPTEIGLPADINNLMYYSTGGSATIINEAESKVFEQ